jgi:PPK2 family polyphosphate:nucleotide phosphotransferase
VQVTAFKQPTPEERRHHFLWRVRRRLPPAGIIGVFDRSHYEDIVAVRVRGLAPRTTWSRRYGVVNRFEEQLVARGTRIVKCFLHVSLAEWYERQLARLDDPTKHWKFDPSDLEDRERWDEYLDAYEDVLDRCSNEYAPWHVVPADHKWYRNWAITKLLVEQLDEMGLRWPPPTFDVGEMRERLSRGA